MRSSTARSLERKWSTKDLEDDIPLVFRKPIWQLRACLASVLITPVLYRLYFIMVTICYILFNKPCKQFSSSPHPDYPVVDLSWTGVFPCELGWKGSALAVLILSTLLIACYSLITACLVRWNPRKQLNIQFCTTSVFDTQKPTKFQVRVQSTNRLMLLPTLNLCILLLIFRLLLQSGDIEANPGPTLGSILILSDLQSVYEKVIGVANDWFNLGLSLGLGHDALDSIKYDYHRNKDCLREMIAARLKTGRLTYSELCQSLRAPTVERNDVADAIEKEYTDDKICSPGPSKRPKLCAIETYKTYLISTYNVRQLPADDRYPLGCVKQFINLKMINRDRSKRQVREVHGKIDRVDKGPVCIEQIACKVGDSFPKLVIIEGAPGVGKTTLSWELCRRWSAGNIWSDYRLVVLLRLRNKSTHEAKSLVDLFECEDKAASQKVWEKLSIKQSKKLLFILEGLDEFPQALRETENCVIMKLIHGKLLPDSTVVITSRPWALDSLNKCRSRIDENIVVLGFTQKQKQEYIDQAIRDGAPAELRTYIAAIPHINSAMYNPLYARIVVQVYIECHDKKHLDNVFPNTITELFKAYCRVLLERYLTDSAVKEDWSRNGDLCKLPHLLQPHFSNLCKIAHKGIVLNKQQLIFYKDDIPEGSTTLGFMNSVHPLYRSITKTTSPSYNFIHLTLQEFLAAFHIWRTYSQQEQLLFIEEQSGEYNSIILFLAGLTKFSDPWTKCILPVPRVRSEDNDETVVYLSGENIREHILRLYESQNEQLIASFDNVVLPIELISPRFDPLYFFALGYCIAVGKFVVEFDIIDPALLTGQSEYDERDLSDWCSVVSNSVQNHRYLLAGLKGHNSKCSSQVKFLYIRWGTLCQFPYSLYEILNYIPVATQGVLQVHIVKQRVLCSLPDNLYKILNYTPATQGLQVGDDEYMPLANSELSTFIENVETVTIPCTILPDSLEVLRYARTLKILHCRIDHSEIPGILYGRITEFCSSLEYLEVTIKIGCADDSDHISDLYDDSESSKSITHLIFGLNIKRFKELNSCQLFPSNFGPIRTGNFTEQVKNYIDHFAPFLKYFGLFTDDYNPLRSSSLKLSVFRSLSKCPLLKKLDIDVESDISDPPRDVRTVSVHRCKDKTLQKLNVQSNNIIEALKENSSVRQLYCNVAFTSDDIVDDFCALLQQNSVLDEIYLQVDNDNDDLQTTGISLLQYLQDNLKPVVSFTFLKQIMEAVCSLTLKKFVIGRTFLNIDQQIIASNDTIVAICNVIENNKYLEYLHLPKMWLEPRQRFLLPIANALSKNSNLTTLILEFKPTHRNSDPITTLEDSKAVGDMLKVNKTLRFLYLMVKISDWSPIFEGLKSNTTIREIHVPLSARKSAIKCIDYVHVRERIKYPMLSQDLSQDDNDDN